jgi:hypothetical protein
MDAARRKFFWRSGTRGAGPRHVRHPAEQQRSEQGGGGDEAVIQGRGVLLGLDEMYRHTDDEQVIGIGEIPPCPR